MSRFVILEGRPAKMLRAIDGQWAKAEIILARFFFGSFLFIDWKRNEWIKSSVM